MSYRSPPHRDAPRSLLENRTAIGGHESTLSLYTIEEPIDQARFRTSHLSYYGVVSGKTILHVNDNGSFSFEPGESLVVPPLQTITVDVPTPNRTPLRYITLKIDREGARTLLERTTAEDSTGTSVPRHQPAGEQEYSYIDNREGVHRVLKMMAYLLRENPPHRDRLIDLNAKELLILMLQTRSRPLLVGKVSRHTSSRGLAAAVQYIQENLDRHISVDELVEEACMSKSTFYRHFSDEFDMSPLKYITRERVVRARELLSDPENTVTSVSHALGFSSTSHFIEMFKEHEGVTPKQYQLEVTE